MIYKLEFENGVVEWCTAKDITHLLKSYDHEIGLHIQELEEIREISDEEAKTIEVKNTDYDEDDPQEMPEKLTLWDLAVGDDFTTIASSEF